MSAKYPTAPYKKLATKVMFNKLLYGPITDLDKRNAALSLRGMGNHVGPLASRMLRHAGECKRMGAPIDPNSPEGKEMSLAGQSLRIW
jgi:hypothetical protein